MSLILIRHGETPLNVARVLQPPATPLSERGLRQADAVGRRMAAMPVHAIVSSDLERAAMTAQAIARHTGLPVQTTELLQERNFGDLRGQPYDHLGFDPISAQEAPAGGESMPQFRERVAAAFAEVLALHHQLQCTQGPHAHLAVVSHGLVIKVILQRHVRLPDGQLAPDGLGNTSVTVVSSAPPYEAALVGCTAHLSELAAIDARSLSGG
jgi:broad specificity phosphatase PhoE